MTTGVVVRLSAYYARHDAMNCACAACEAVRGQQGAAVRWPAPTWRWLMEASRRETSGAWAVFTKAANERGASDDARGVA